VPDEENALTFAAFDRDGRRLVTAGVDDKAYVWDLKNKVLLFYGLEHTADVTHAAFSPDGRLVVTAGRDQRVQVWETGEGKPLAPLEPGAAVLYPAFPADGRRLATACHDGTVRVWHLGATQTSPSGGPSLAPELVASWKHPGAVVHALFA